MPNVEENRSTVLVAGATGYIGGRLIRAFRAGSRSFNSDNLAMLSPITPAQRNSPIEKANLAAGSWVY